MPVSAYKVRYQIAPIILTGGIAQNVPGGMISMLAGSNPNLILPTLYSEGAQRNLLDALNPSGQIIGTQGDPSTSPGFSNFDDAFGAFNVLAGGTLCVQTVPKYPLADMTLAANAIVREPLTLSLIWDTPMRGANAWDTKLTVMQALKMMLDQHNNAGGLYAVMTPAFFYENLILTALTDNSRGGNSLPQNAWRFDFERPMVVNTTDLTTIGYGAQNIALQKMTAGLPASGTLYGYNMPAVSSSSQNPPLKPPAGSLVPISPSLGGVPAPILS
jgi:hypothetical protein